MEREPQIHQNLEETLREKGYKIEKIEEENWNQCGCGNCFEDAKWSIEGSAYCPQHKEGALKILEESDREYEKTKMEQKRITKERKEQFRKLWKPYYKDSRQNNGE